ncbi:MAG TPA: TauD/TfdA family dioxygenase [Stellaceae bacterium]|jgi:alpha-ketoglutarate-dependent 2,4-dichlorophenoxyacetate dioxygenase
MALRVTPLHPHIGAEIVGVDLTRPMPADVFAEIEAAFNRHAVLVFPDQPLTDERQIAFSRHFGPLEVTPNYAGDKLRIRADVADISNLDHEGRVLSADDRRRVFNLGNQLWHTDSSFKRVPAKCSLLSAREIPPTGGETEFADMRAAYDALSEERKRQLDGLVAEHSIYYSRSRIGFGNFNDDISRQLPPVPQLLVRRHPGSGRKNLYLASHASHVIGWPVEQGRALIDELIAFATQPRFVYSHRWRVGDLVMWDNRCTMHRGRPYDETCRRVMHRTTVSDTANSVEQERGEQEKPPIPAA